ncbi:unnamed protein product, partial [Brachionus calyciflorus]
MNIEEIKEYSLSNNIEKLIPCLKENGLISSKSPLCLKCNKEMKWTIKTTLSDYYLWRCSCGDSKSIRHFSFF